jgi:hypothetical protein
MKVAVHIIGSILLSFPILYALGGILDDARLGLLAWTGNHRVADMCARRLRGIAGGALASPELRISSTRKRPTTTGGSGSIPVLGGALGSPSAKLTLVIALSERHTARAQDVVCGDGVEIEVGQRKRKDQGLRREG